VAKMDIEKLYKNEIDFKSFENEIQLWGMKYPSICNIIFYSGMRDRRYIILFEINKSLESVFLTDDYRPAPISNFLENQDGKDMLIKAKSLDYSLDKSFLDNWYIFSKDINSELFSLCDPLFREKCASDDLSLEVYTKLRREDKIKMTEPLKRFIPPEKGMPESGPIWFLNYSKNSKDFVGDKSWTLSKKGFEKFIILENSKVLFCRDDIKVESKKKLRPNQEDKIACQKIALNIWKEYEILDIVHLKKHPDIKKIAGGAYKFYKETTIHKWLSEIAPKSAKKKGKRPKEIREKQQKICKKLKIIM
jgi:hypothetical protein